MTLYGWRCAHCMKQWMASKCLTCSVVGQHVAKPTGFVNGKQWVCGKCRKAAA